MNNPIKLFDSVSQKTLELVKNYKVLKEENSKLLNERKNHIEEINNNNKRIKILEDEIQMLRISKSVFNDEGSHDLKNRIDELVRGIDKSLELLKKK